MKTFHDILIAATSTAYPEPDTQLHSLIIPKVIAKFEKWLPAPATILDIGCGSCMGAVQLRDKGYNVTPISTLESEVEHARGLGFRSVKCEMHATELLGHFDVAWLRHVAEHSPCPLLLLTNLAEQADWLYLEVPLPETGCRHETNPNHYSCLTINGWGRLLVSSGWRIVSNEIMSFETQAGDDQYAVFICKKNTESK